MIEVLVSTFTLQIVPLVVSPSSIVVLALNLVGFKHSR